MTDRSPLEPSEEGNFDDTLVFLESGFRNYMNAREILSSLSESTVRRHSRHLPKGPRLTNEEKALMHGMIAAMYAYYRNAVKATQAGADFASGVMASAACEALAIIQLIQNKSHVRTTTGFKKLWKKYRGRPAKPSVRKTFVKFLLEQRAEDLFRIAREAGVYHEQDLPNLVDQVLQRQGYPGRLGDFVRFARNCVHPRWMLQANERHARFFRASGLLEGMHAFHIDFALCAWELHGRLSGSPKGESIGSPCPPNVLQTRLPGDHAGIGDRTPHED